MSWLTERLKVWLELAPRRPDFDIRPYEELRNIHLRRFGAADPDRFVRLWCAAAAACEIAPLELHEDLRPSEFNHRQWWQPGGLNDSRYEALWELVFVEEGKGRRRPRPELDTVGDVLDYLLFSDDGIPRSDGPPKRSASNVYRR